MRLNSLSGFNSKASDERIQSGIGIHLGGIDVEFLAPHEFGLLALFHNRFEEAAKNVQSITGANTAQARMIGERLVEIIAQIPTNTQAVSRLEHELAFGANALKKHHQLQLKKDNRVNRRTTQVCIGLLDKRPYKREIQLLLQMPIEIVLWDEFF